MTITVVEIELVYADGTVARRFSERMERGDTLEVSALPPGTLVKWKSRVVTGAGASVWGDWNSVTVSEQGQVLVANAYDGHPDATEPDGPEATCVGCGESKPLRDMSWTSDPYDSELHDRVTNEGWWCQDCFKLSSDEI